jgi:hypothetical protein
MLCCKLLALGDKGAPKMGIIEQGSSLVAYHLLSPNETLGPSIEESRASLIIEKL